MISYDNVSAIEDGCDPCSEHETECFTYHLTLTFRHCGRDVTMIMQDEPTCEEVGGGGIALIAGSATGHPFSVSPLHAPNLFECASLAGFT